MNYRLMILLFLCSNTFLGQTKMSVPLLLEKVNQTYAENKDISYTTAYFIYKERNSKEVVDQYSGATINQGNIQYQRLNQSEYVNFGDCFVSIDHKEKKILVANQSRKKEISSVTSMLKLFDKSKLSQDKNYWICELASKGNGNQYDKLIIYISKQDFSLHKQLFYIIGSQEIVKNKKNIMLKNPRMEILFTKKNQNTASDELMLSMSYYFKMKNKKVILSSRFKKYKLITL
jgi:hypothetical protein